MTWTALPITSAGRFSPFGPRGIPDRLLLCGKHATIRGWILAVMPIDAFLTTLPYQNNNVRVSCSNVDAEVSYNTPCGEFQHWTQCSSFAHDSGLSACMAHIQRGDKEASPETKATASKG